MLLKLINLKGLNEHSIQLTKYFIILSMITSARLVFADGYMILFILDNIDFKEVGILFSILFILQGLVDFQTGVIGEWIGHK